MEYKMVYDDLKNAITALKESIMAYDEHCESSEVLQRALRSAVVHDFEVAYELAWKFMKRWMDTNIHPSISMNVSRKEFYRRCAERGMIEELEDWWVFHDARNKTSHTYNQLIADYVLGIARQFVPSAWDLARQLEAMS